MTRPQTATAILTLSLGLLVAILVVLPLGALGWLSGLLWASWLQGWRVGRNYVEGKT